MMKRYSVTKLNQVQSSDEIRKRQAAAQQKPKEQPKAPVAVKK